MSRRLPTIQDRNKLPVPPDFVKLANEWCEEASMLLLVSVWEGFDLFKNKVLSQINWHLEYEELERSITQYFVQMIRDRMTMWEPFYVEHSPYQVERRMPAPAQSPQYDIAFVMYADIRIMWPLEAKLLHTDGEVAPYIKDIKNEFLTCRYAPFSSEAGMLGYLLSGTPSKAFSNIEKKLGYKLTHHPKFPERNHKISEHKRAVPSGKSYPADFRCHHLILEITGSVASS